MQMLSALSSNPEYWRPKLNVIILLAPLTCLHHSENQIIQQYIDSASFMAAIKTLATSAGEIMPEPQGTGTISSNLLNFTGVGAKNIKTMSDSNIEHVDPKGLETFYGQFPSGTSLRCLNHFR
jgi:hypothetical protein